MHRRDKTAGFTLIELLVVTAILAIIAAITFPVYRGAVAAAKRTVCVNNFNAVGKAMMMYTTDYDDFVPPVNYTYVSFNQGNADRTWVQTIAPYAGDFRLFTCPSDTGRDASGTPNGWQGYYRASLRSNLGYNYMYLSPLAEVAGEWKSHPVSLSSISNLSRTLTFIDSVWDRSETGKPVGGGSWVIAPPCRYIEIDGVVEDSFNLPYGARSYFGFSPVGWQPSSSTSWLVYGGAWPWHSGQFTMAYADGRADVVTVNELIAGCDFRASWRGNIKNSSAYIWDLGD